MIFTISGGQLSRPFSITNDKSFTTLAVSGLFNAEGRVFNTESSYCVQININCGEKYYNFLSNMSCRNQQQ